MRVRTWDNLTSKWWTQKKCSTLFLYETLRPIKLSKEKLQLEFILRFSGMRSVGPTFGVKKKTFSKCIGKIWECWGYDLNHCRVNSYPLEFDWFKRIQTLPISFALTRNSPEIRRPNTPWWLKNLNLFVGCLESWIALTLLACETNKSVAWKLSR